MKSRNRWHSFTAALHGMAHTVLTQRNAWIEVAAACGVAAAGIWLHIQPLEWALLALVVALILALEAVNTAIEAVVDLVSPAIHPLARIAKDCAAGALLFATLGALGVAAAIFGPRLAVMLTG
ncbi:MAG: diacylglycerol kinase family protein [Caldilineales bacterium]|mgnify:CR=1 FL=1